MRRQNRIITTPSLKYPGLNPVRNSSHWPQRLLTDGALNPAGMVQNIILAIGELQSSGALFLTG